MGDGGRADAGLIAARTLRHRPMPRARGGPPARAAHHPRRCPRMSTGRGSRLAAPTTPHLAPDRTTWLDCDRRDGGSWGA
jgi:hypothetical protein